MTVHVIILIGIMIVSGMFGGIINFLINKKRKNTITKSIILGVGASFLVPLFLKMISSNLIEDTMVKPNEVLVFIGFCLIASISSTAFIGGISDYVLSELIELKEKTKKVEDKVQQTENKASDTANEVKGFKENVKPLINMKTEPDYKAKLMMSRESIVNLDDNEKSVLAALSSSEYIYRSIGGLEKDTKLDSTILSDTIDKLISEGLAAKIDSPDGTRWHITEEGTKVI